MRSDNHLWQLSFEELAHKCRDLAQTRSSELEPGLREEAQRIQSGWTDVFAIDKHENDARERIAAATAALRKRTIELLVKADEQMA